MNKMWLSVLCTCICICGHAQEVERMVVTSCAGSGNSTAGHLQWVLGDYGGFGGNCETVYLGFVQPDGFPVCVGDLNSDSAVNVSDLLIFTAYFGASGDCLSPDLNSDGSVNVSDLLIFTAMFGNVCW